VSNCPEIEVECASFLAPPSERAPEALSHIPDVEIVVTDMSMPGEDGAWLLAQVEQSRSPIPVIVLTGLDHRDFPGAKFSRVLRKPFDLWQLCEEIRAVLGGPRQVSDAQ
jgi:CheY-like chemotaxis protein